MDTDPHRTATPELARAYSYIRLSSKRQANQDDKKAYRDGFRRQVELREDYLKANPHLTLDTTLALHDIGVSAYSKANVARGGPGKLAAFQAAVDNGLVPKGSYLLLESLDRFSRADVATAQHALLGLVNAGIIVVTLTDGMVYRSNPEDMASQANFMFSVMTLMRGHEESRVKSQRLQKTWEQKRRSIGTRRLTKRAPGWLDDVDGTFIPNARAGVVRQIMEWLADGFGRDQIARFLNADTRPEAACWGHGRQWHGGTVQKVTDNRAMIGEFQPHKLVFTEVNGIRKGTRTPVGDPIPDYYPRIVDDELWARARAVADKRRMGRAPNAGGRQGVVISNLFGMVATCGKCGKPMNYRDRGQRSTTILRCSENRAGTCSNDYKVPYVDTENAVLSWLVKLDLTGGAKGEIARLEQALQAEVAKRAELKVRGEAIVRQFQAYMQFAERPLEEIARESAASERRIADISATLSTLRAQGGRDARAMAIGELLRLQDLRASAVEAGDIADADTDLWAVRTRIRQIIRDTFTKMLCQPDGHIEITTVDGAQHRFRDGFWWNEEVRGWIPWAGAMFGMGYKATRAELRRRAAWLAEAEAACPPLSWMDARTPGDAAAGQD